MRRAFLYTISALTLTSFTALAAPKTLTASGGKVEATAVGKPSFIKIQCKGEPPKGKVDVDGQKVTGEFEFAMATLDSGIKLRNEHMLNKYLLVKEHPTAKLVIKELTLAKPFDAANPAVGKAPFKGELTLKGVTKPVEGTFEVAASKEVDATFKIKLTDYQVEIPKYAGITVADEVDVKVKIASLK